MDWQNIPVDLLYPMSPKLRGYGGGGGGVIVELVTTQR
jgi:hypothetical protein